MLEQITVVIPFLNEESRLRFILNRYKGIPHILGVDAGSSDGSAELLSSSGHRVISLPNSDGDRSSQWLMQVLSSVNTPYVLFNNCAYIYSDATLKRLDNISIESRLPCCFFSDVYIVYGKPLRIASAYNIVCFIIKYGLRCMMAKGQTTVSSNFFRVDRLSFADISIFNEKPVRITLLDFIKTIPLLPLLIQIYARDDTSLSIELKHAKYATQYASTKRFVSAFPVLLLPFVYPYYFIQSYFLSFAFLQGLPGFFHSHYWASFQVSWRIRAYENKNQLNDQLKIVEINRGAIK